MEKKAFGIILTLLGIVGLVMAGINFMKDSGSSHHIKQIITYSVLGLIFFFAGIGLMRGTGDRTT